MVRLMNGPIKRIAGSAPARTHPRPLHGNAPIHKVTCLCVHTKLLCSCYPSSTEEMLPLAFLGLNVVFSYSVWILLGWYYARPASASRAVLSVTFISPMDWLVDFEWSSPASTSLWPSSGHCHLEGDGVAGKVTWNEGVKPGRRRS